MSLSKQQIKEFEIIAGKLRQSIVRMIGPENPGHLGGSCSIAELLTILYFNRMRHDPSDPKWPQRDRFILSKGHAALALYAVLCECGYFPEKELKTIKQIGSILQGHPDMLKVPGIEANTGSLGQGLSIACGIALAGKLDKIDYQVYCLMGDGEIAEGQIWEASMAASYYKLDNLTAILDKNRVQATGTIIERYDTNPHKEKWLADNWYVIEVDGHNFTEIENALVQAGNNKGKPTLIIAHTVKGKGIPFAENKAAFHNGIMSREQFDQALEAVRI
jgi:transketolase